MKLRYLFTALLFTGAAAPLQAQSIDHMRKLLQEIQQEIDCLEKEQAETLKPQKEPQPVESTEYVDGVIAVDTLPSGNDCSTTTHGNTSATATTSRTAKSTPAAGTRPNSFPTATW